MANVEEEQKDIEIPSDEDENVGGDTPKEKKKKRKKTREERIAERKVIFWTFLLVMILTLSFWLVPKVKGIINGDWQNQSTKEETKTKEEAPKGPKNYVEITL